ncbi:MAG TPA: peptidylprolyl isomerase [Candidatus Angelobacter sp.]|nr:peptidylprolyl isomerase [Candidatus Angelobacter sp.]
MRRIVFILLLTAGMAQAQKRGTLPTASDPQQPRASQHASSSMAAPVAGAQAKAPATELPGEASVITLKGLCSAEKAADPKACVSTISKDQFEDVLSAVSLGGQAFSPGAIRNVADNYVQNLVLADAAVKAGVDTDPRVQELLRIVQMRTLAEAYRRALEEKYRSPSAQEIKTYYEANISRYQTVRAERLMVPKFNPRQPKDESGEFQKKAAVVAAEIRERAANGEPLDRLQNDAFLKLGITPPAILPETGLRRRGTFPPGVEEEVFLLKPGEVSKVLSETGGFVIYRMLDKPVYTLEQVKGEIVRDIYQQKMEVAVKGALQSAKTEFNDQYFAPRSTPRALPVKGEAPQKGLGPHRLRPSHSVKLPPAGAAAKKR